MFGNKLESRGAWGEFSAWWHYISSAENPGDSRNHEKLCDFTIRWLPIARAYWCHSSVFFPEQIRPWQRRRFEERFPAVQKSSSGKWPSDITANCPASVVQLRRELRRQWNAFQAHLRCTAVVVVHKALPSVLTGECAAASQLPSELSRAHEWRPSGDFILPEVGEPVTQLLLMYHTALQKPFII